MDLKYNIYSLLTVIFVLGLGEGSARALNAANFLQKYGYLRSHNGLDLAKGLDFKDAVRSFQRFNELPITGEVDNVTEALMTAPRCGVPDIDPKVRRHRRYDLLGSKWRLRNLKYDVSSYPDEYKLTRQEVDRILASAFKIWSDVSPLQFIRSFNPDISIQFASGYHGDSEPFDGRGGVLAHATQPYFGGDVHIDNDETWSQGTYRGINLFQVVAHEIGHSLGLGHSKVRASLMAPSYKGYVPNFSLHQDDIQGIKRLYGSKQVNPRPGNDQPPRSSVSRDPVTTTTTTTKTTTTTAAAAPPTDKSFCNRNINIDAIVSVRGTQVTFAFSGDQYYRLTEVGVAAGFPRNIRADWQGSQGRVDAALSVGETTSYACGLGQCHRRRGVIYLFESYYVMKYDSNLNALWGSQKVISAAFPGLPANIDAAFFSEALNRIYYFKGANYYRSSDITNEGPIRVDQGYPRSSQIWNIPTPVGAVVSWTGDRQSYFFYGPDYYRYNYNQLRPAAGYPRDVKRWWMDCQYSRYVEQLDESGGAVSKSAAHGQDGHQDGHQDNHQDNHQDGRQTEPLELLDADSWETRAEHVYGTSNHLRPTEILVLLVILKIVNSFL